jgi:hypothetical protein
LLTCQHARQIFHFLRDTLDAARRFGSDPLTLGHLIVILFVAGEVGITEALSFGYIEHRAKHL